MPIPAVNLDIDGFPYKDYSKIPRTSFTAKVVWLGHRKHGKGSVLKILKKRRRQESGMTLKSNSLHTQWELNIPESGHWHRNHTAWISWRSCLKKLNFNFSLMLLWSLTALQMMLINSNHKPLWNTFKAQIELNKQAKHQYPKGVLALGLTIEKIPIQTHNKIFTSINHCETINSWHSTAAYLKSMGSCCSQGKQEVRLGWLFGFSMCVCE